MSKQTIDDDDLEGFGTGSAAEALDIAETRLRLPRSLIRQLKLLAEARSMSMNALVAGFIDAGLIQAGRPGLAELAPGFSNYLKPKGGRKP
jgi:hypothetical protein